MSKSFEISLADKVKIYITPKELANIFWDMDNIQQAEFFIALGSLTNGEHKAEMQWLYLKDELKSMDNGDIGIQCIRDIAAWHYLYLLGLGDIAA